MPRKPSVHNPQTANERAKRIKCLREMTGLTRAAIQQRYNIARGTLQNWESARFGGLTIKGAMLIVRAMQAEGIAVTSDWLLHGIGDPPSFMPDQSMQPHKKDLNAELYPPHITQELLTYKNNNDDVIDMVMPDNSMWPQIQKNDHVAGIRCYQIQLDKCIDKICIVQTAEHGTVVRQLELDNTTNLYKLKALNIDTNDSLGPINHATIISAAPISWVRVMKREPLLKYLQAQMYSLPEPI